MTDFYGDNPSGGQRLNVAEPPTYPSADIMALLRQYQGQLTPEPVAPPRLGFRDRLALAARNIQPPGAMGRPGDVFGASLLAGLAHAYSLPRTQAIAYRQQAAEAASQGLAKERAAELATRVKGLEEAHRAKLDAFKQAAVDFKQAKRDLEQHRLRMLEKVPPKTGAQIEQEAFRRARGTRRGNPPQPKATRTPRPSYTDMNAKLALIERFGNAGSKGEADVIRRSIPADSPLVNDEDLRAAYQDAVAASKPKGKK